MITILYDTASERENVKYFINVSGECCDFSDSMTIEQCENRECENCCQNFIEHCIISRTDYNSMDFLPLEEERSCNTCANNPICWLSSTAAAPAPCAHYIPEVYKHESK